LLASVLWTGILMMAPNTSFTHAAGDGGSHFIDLAIDTIRSTQS
jgi:hypothetical protein